MGVVVDRDQVVGELSDPLGRFDHLEFDQRVGQSLMGCDVASIELDGLDETPSRGLGLIRSQEQATECVPILGMFFSEDGLFGEPVLEFGQAFGLEHARGGPDPGFEQVWVLG